ncbi:hypothetical protein GCM10009799_14670 [Nocardiopsis rhodophaea]|uniref:Uncharacterized protein n=1 Tax=Nocardiopsis rhodophaea TaxID=280238 RepID=A0ABN2SQR6_9ACTN
MKGLSHDLGKGKGESGGESIGLFGASILRGAPGWFQVCVPPVGAVRRCEARVWGRWGSSTVRAEAGTEAERRPRGRKMARCRGTDGDRTSGVSEWCPRVEARRQRWRASAG